jgi:hypothetical protein
MNLNFIKRLFGWSDCHNFPQEKCIIVFIHTSYWDSFTYFLYKISSYGSNLCALVQPKLSRWYYRPFTYLLDCIYAPPNENKNSNSIEYIVREMNKISNPMLCISPKGTCSKREWRTGYYHIAKRLQCKIYPLFINYSTRTMTIGEPVDPSITDVQESTRTLQEQLSNHSVLYNELSEVTIHDSKCCPYELILPFDFCAISTLSFMPCVISLFANGQVIRGILSLITTIFAYYYHLQKEGTLYSHENIMKFQKIEGHMAKLCILSHIIENVYKYRRLEPIFYLSFIIGIFFYKNSIPRGISPIRGKYVIFHSIYHILVGIAGYSLTIQQE